eukprot:s675_g7.t2
MSERHSRTRHSRCPIAAGRDATTSLQPPPATTHANASLDNKTQVLTRGGLHLLYEPTAEDKWIFRQIATCEEGGYKDAQTGEPLNREDEASYELYQQRFSERYRVGEQADRLVQIVDRYMPRIADENRAYVMRYPDKVGEMLQKAWKLRKKIRQRQSLTQKSHGRSAEASPQTTKSPAAIFHDCAFAAMLAIEAGMTMEEINKCSLAASNAWADECMAKAIAPSKANVQAVAIRGSGPADKITVKTSPSDALPVVKTRPEFEKVWNTYGSSAGSGSCSIPIYNKHRRIELARLEKMDKDHAALEEATEFQAKREAAIAADEAATEKKRAKRQKRKDAKAKSQQLKKEADGINKFGSDGSFLDTCLKTLATRILFRGSVSAKDKTKHLQGYDGKDGSQGVGGGSQKSQGGCSGRCKGGSSCESVHHHTDTDELPAEHFRPRCGGLIRRRVTEPFHQIQMRRHLPRSRSAPQVNQAVNLGNFLQIPTGITNVKAPGSHLFRTWNPEISAQRTTWRRDAHSCTQALHFFFYLRMVRLLHTPLLSLTAFGVQAIDNGIGLTPPRGWRSWNAFDC